MVHGIFGNTTDKQAKIILSFHLWWWVIINYLSSEQTLFQTRCIMLGGKEKKNVHSRHD